MTHNDKTKNLITTFITVPSAIITALAAITLAIMFFLTPLSIPMLSILAVAIPAGTCLLSIAISAAIGHFGNRDASEKPAAAAEETAAPAEETAAPAEETAAAEQTVASVAEQGTDSAASVVEPGTDPAASAVPGSDSANPKGSTVSDPIKEKQLQLGFITAAATKPAAKKIAAREKPDTIALEAMLNRRTATAKC